MSISRAKGLIIVIEHTLRWHRLCVSRVTDVSEENSASNFKFDSDGNNIKVLSGNSDY